MTTYAPSGKPIWAVTAWTDNHSVYIELPCTDGPPYIQSFPLTEGGLGKALNLMRDLHSKVEVKIGGSYGVLIEHPKLKKLGAPDDQREAARSIMKKLGLLR